MIIKNRTLKIGHALLCYTSPKKESFEKHTKQPGPDANDFVG
jgi:hypothetical protein